MNSNGTDNNMHHKNDYGCLETTPKMDKSKKIKYLMYNYLRAF